MADILDDIREDVILVPDKLKSYFLKELIISYIIYFALWNCFQSAYWAEIHDIMYYSVLHGIFTTICGFTNLTILKLRVLSLKNNLHELNLGHVLRNIVFATTFSILIGFMVMVAVVLFNFYFEDVIAELPNYIFVTGQLTLIGMGIYYFVFTVADDLIK